MNLVETYAVVARFLVKAGAAFGAGGFWGMAFALVLANVFDISGDNAMLYGALPVTALFTFFIWPRLPKILGFER